MQTTADYSKLQQNKLSASRPASSLLNSVTIVLPSIDNIIPHISVNRYLI